MITTCLLWLCRALNVWKNSSCVASLLARNWMSSISRMSTLRYNCLKLAPSSSRMELMKSLVNSSELTYRTGCRCRGGGRNARWRAAGGFFPSPESP